MGFTELVRVVARRHTRHFVPLFIRKAVLPPSVLNPRAPMVPPRGQTPITRTTAGQAPVVAAYRRPHLAGVHNQATRAFPCKSRDARQLRAGKARRAWASIRPHTMLQDE